MLPWILTGIIFVDRFVLAVVATSKDGKIPKRFLSVLAITGAAMAGLASAMIGTDV